MKKNLLLLALLCLPLVLSAKKHDDSKYLRGAVPEENGIITFRKSFTVTDKNTSEIYDILQTFVRDSITGKAIQNQNPIYTRIISEDKAEGTIVARVEEYMTFHKQFFNLDRTRFRYQLVANVMGQKVNLTVTQISYYYNEDMDGKGGITYKGEEWISDSEALNKAGTKLLPRSGKFRRLTVDRVSGIFESSMDALSTMEVKTQEVVKKRKGIEE